MAERWICDQCGAPARGELCKSCGNSYAPQSPPGPQPGSYYSILGIRTFDGFKAYGWSSIALLLVLSGVIWGVVGFLLFAGIWLLAWGVPRLFMWLSLLFARRSRRRGR